MNQAILDYWKEAIQCSFEEARIPFLSDDLLNTVAHDMAMASENKQMAFGGDFRPSKTEKSQEITGLENRIKELEERDLIFRQSVAKRRRVPVEDVYIENGDVKYDITHKY